MKLAILLTTVALAVAAPRGSAAQVDSAEAQAAAAERSRRSANKKVEEIVVFARKRAEFLEDTPVSVTALSEETLRNTNTTRLDQIQDLVPNLSMFRGISGQTLSVNVRGVGNFPTIYFDQGVALYVDGIYLSRNQGSVLDIVDVQQVEVLRGPQGTIFGKNTLGGAINITTVKPKDELEGYLMLRTGSYGQIDSRATINIPLVEEKLALRATFANFKNSGYVYNEIRDEHLSNRNSINFLGTLRFTPTDWITFDVTGNWGKSRTRTQGGRCQFIEPENITDSFSLIIQSIEATVTNAGGVFPDDYRDRCNGTAPFRIRADVPQLAKVEAGGAWGVLDIDLGDTEWVQDLSLILRSSWREQYPGNRIDSESTEFPVSVVDSLGGGPFVETLDGPRAGEILNLGGALGFQRQIQQELQINGSAWDGRINFVTGAFSFWEEAMTTTGITAFPGGVLGSPPIGLVPGLGTTETSNWDWAIYGQATADLTDWLSITAGIRYTQEKKGLQRELEQPFAMTGVNEPLAVSFQGDRIFTDWTPMASIALKAPESWLEVANMEHVMTYFTYSRGFRGGGWNGGARTSDERTIEPFKPETMDSYEVGFKSIFAERKLSLNFAFFHAERQNQQTIQIINAVVTPVVTVPDVIIRNASESTAQGVEVELLAQPLPGLLISGSMGWLDAIYDDFPGVQNARTGEEINRRGQRFPFLPQWQAHVGAQFTQPLPDMGQPRFLEGSLTPRLDWTYQGDTQYWAPELPELLQKSYNLLNFRLTYLFNDTQSSVAFFANNLLDEEYFRDSLSVGPRLTLAVLQYYEPPRWFGVEISHRF